MSTLMGISLSAKRGILFKEASYLETMAKCDIIALDKTGTLTEGKPKVVETKFLKEFDISLLYSLVNNSNHPISKGIKNYISQNYENYKELKLQDLNSIQAKGMSATYGKQKIFGGNSALMLENGIDAKNISANLIFNFAIDDELVASFELKDTPKNGAKEMIESLKSLGLKVVMLTGDHEKSAKSIASELGIYDIKWGLLPTGKADMIDIYHKQNKKVIMVGDGINDSIALAKSDIAISMGSGADIAISVSDVVLLNDNITKVSEAMQISKRTYKAIKENLSLSIIYNIIAIPLAVAGFVYPLVSALSMSLSSLIVVGNSIRIKRLKFKK
ncbi:Copper-exporting P-type ATPase A (fragment 1) [Sulfurovum sp. enrichment culture clone C5]|uniref:P-type Cu(+) transporter n=1 Tax=Sulfurovum sp. enrichment culture clone C5 TaxID=497650 RepID=A0A0S4XPX8_9BACT|nr:Copper-exporting P-type ATPase A (fragment 1) [Sulfurovum sp. enrichment culture clone C5]